MLYGKRLAVPLKAVWNTELAKAYAETVHGTDRGYTKHRLHATVKSNVASFHGQVACVRVEWDELPAGLHQGHKLPVRVPWQRYSKFEVSESGGSGATGGSAHAGGQS